jgi:ApaG protein
MYTATTDGITVKVTPVYLHDHSDPEQNHFVWAYNVVITNNGKEGIQLLNRYWRITDEYGRLHEVRGPGVVGMKPALNPGESFEYTSGTSLKTPSGIMNGTYEMSLRNNDKILDVEIPAFSLDSPYNSKIQN